MKKYKCDNCKDRQLIKTDNLGWEMETDLEWCDKCPPSYFVYLIPLAIIAFLVAGLLK